MISLATMANDELADLYCALFAEHVNLVRHAPFPDPQYVTDLEDDIRRIHEEIAARGMFEYEAA